ncbi:uncharacterized protein ACLA_088260 [Aspergillus clavatus NRRL 1]|uniref:Uncharacterized protein n=1 Tax=Aspergillus clavatus (strain ATCC 1007 / CBS 513.65 / DSM 816 / NCTC 3887 / NRRL 1 / QM 1276 / 107) TaxID=344612 RepID=A1CE38_ASPCL|nr:uncharacterized protein ACLA_088260 [Aspergillus clavatus NRRL 1]EAW11137.1 hypothetical protein ACLA_088260 [Aspergillus clavatus NRRL 1]
MAISSSLATLSAFPFLTLEEFWSACCALSSRLDGIADPARLGYSSIRLMQQVAVSNSPGLFKTPVLNRRTMFYQE